MPKLINNKYFYILSSFIFLILGILLIFYGEKNIGLLMLFFMALTLFLPFSTDYLSPQFAFATPWFAILIFSKFEISEIYRNVDFFVYELLLTCICTFLFLSCLCSSKIKKDINLNNLYVLKNKKNLFLFFIFLFFAIANVVYAGYIPLVNILLGVYADYLKFGIKGFYGFFNAFANVVGLIFFYTYLIKKEKIYLIFYIVVALVFLLFVSRQNILSLLIESFVIYSFVRSRVTYKKILVMFTVLMFCFSLIGSLRSGDIKVVAKIVPEYQWLPDSFVWGYSYSFFNILNLENIISEQGVPYYDLSSMDMLIPSVFRPQAVETRSLLENDSFTVSSFISPIYRDGGIFFTLFWVAIISYLTSKQYQAIYRKKTMRSMLIYSVLYFCALMSFFTNFWFYLPVIAQIPIIVYLTKDEKMVA